MQLSSFHFLILYLSAIVLANLTVLWFGPKMSVINAFLFIGLDLTSRDYLHEAWRGKNLIWRMGALIAAGSAITWLLNRDAGRIAIASMVAFALAVVVDSITYQVLRDRTYLVKINGSNALSALVDSITFPTLAFGVLMPWIVLGQFVAKVLGGYVWSRVLVRNRYVLD